MNKLIVKVNYGKEVRRIAIPTANIDALHNSVAQLLTLDPQNITLKYLDEENDMITLSSQPELEEAIRSLSQEDPILKIYVFRKGNNQKIASPNNNNNSANSPQPALSSSSSVPNPNFNNQPQPQKAEAPRVAQPEGNTPKAEPSLLDSFNVSLESSYNEFMTRAKEATQSLQTQANQLVESCNPEFVQKMVQFLELQIQTFFAQVDLISKQLAEQMKGLQPQEAKAKCDTFQKYVQVQFQHALQNVQELATNLFQMAQMHSQQNPSAENTEKNNSNNSNEQNVPEQKFAEQAPHEDVELNSFVVVSRNEEEEEQQQPEQEEVLSTEMASLIEMGFTDKEKNALLLQKHNNNLASVIGELIG